MIRAGILPWKDYSYTDRKRYIFPSEILLIYYAHDEVLIIINYRLFDVKLLRILYFKFRTAWKVYLNNITSKSGFRLCCRVIIRRVGFYITCGNLYKLSEKKSKWILWKFFRFITENSMIIILIILMLLATESFKTRSGWLYIWYRNVVFNKFVLKILRIY